MRLRDASRVSGVVGAGWRRTSGRRAAVGRALTATAAMALGFLTVFGGFGVLIVSVASTVQQYLPYVTVVIGVVLVVLGIWLLTGREFTASCRMRLRGRHGWRRRRGSDRCSATAWHTRSASLSCTIGPFLAVTGASFGGGPVLDGLLVYVAYAAGMALVVGVLAIATALANAAVVERARRILPYVNRVSGVC